MTDWLITKSASKMTLSFGLQDMEVDSEVGWGVANVGNGGGGRVPHPDMVEYHESWRLASGRKIIARKRQDDWWKSHSISKILKVVLKSM